MPWSVYCLCYIGLLWTVDLACLLLLYKTWVYFRLSFLVRTSTQYTWTTSGLARLIASVQVSLKVYTAFRRSHGRLEYSTRSSLETKSYNIAITAA
jgi:hypothetical protein